jgi:hypothetical protein
MALDIVTYALGPRLSLWFQALVMRPEIGKNSPHTWVLCMFRVILFILEMPIGKKLSTKKNDKTI